MTEPLEDGTAIERLLRVAARARSESEETDDHARNGVDCDEKCDTKPIDGPELRSPPPRSKDAWIGNLCREIPMPPYGLDPAACADAMMAMASPSRTLSAFRRARAEASYGAQWAEEVHAGESMIDTMSRVIAQGMPMPPVIGIIQGPGLDQMRAEFDALPSCERADEIQRHLWAMAEPTRVRTRFSALLSAIGIS